MTFIGRTLIFAALVLPAGAALAATPVPSPNASTIKSLNHQMHMMLQDVGHKNEQAEVSLEPDPSGLKTIVKVHVHPSNAGQYRSDLTKKVNEYIQIHKGECKTNKSMVGVQAIPLNPINNGVSQTTVNFPISTLTGHGNAVYTGYPGGTVVNCGTI